MSEIGDRYRFLRNLYLSPISLVLALVAATDAGAHLGNISYADFQVRGADVVLQFKYAAHVTPGLADEGASTATRAKLLALRGGIQEWLGQTTSVISAGKRCSLAIDNIVGPDRNDDLEVIAVWTCDVPDIKGVRINFHPLGAVLEDWQTIASLRLGAQTFSTVLTPNATRWQVGDAGPEVEEAAGKDGQPASGGDANQPPSGGDAQSLGDSAFARFFALGVHHIWTGYDHLLFLFAVLLAGGGLARLAAIVTSFTIAHSITLGAAATGAVHLPVAPVEALIALSIVFVAAENMLGRGADRRALVTFGFGLVHGFGFASVLGETAIPASGIVVPLLAFNLGVEAGQLAVVVAVVPLLALALRSRHAHRITFVLSALIALAGAGWAVERIAAMLA